MKVVLASTSALKLEACRLAFAKVANVEFVLVKVPSGVPEQPMGPQTLRGAYNRLAAAMEAIPGADLYISIENGIFKTGRNKYVDRAVVVMQTADGRTEVAQSDAVEFPAASVKEAERRGFNLWTVGKVMEEQGIVAKNYDPHFSLTGKTRAAYISETVQRAVRNLGQKSGRAFA